MSTDTTVVFLHGMGKHDGTFHEAAWSFLAAKHQQLTGEPLKATALPLVYDDIFESLRSAGTLADLKPFIKDERVLDAVGDLQSSSAFIYTHVLDVLVWRFHFAARSRIITQLAADLAPLIAALTDSSKNLVVIAHSLGTAVATEVIHFLGTQGMSDFQKIPAVHMLADVAKVLERPEVSAYNPPHPSFCRPWNRDPQDRAALQHYFNYRNVLDPIPMVDRFRPQWPATVYHERVFQAWGDPVQPHDLLTYVKAPEVYVKLLRSITLDAATYTNERENQEIAAAKAAATSGKASQEQFQKLALRFGDKQDLGDLVKLGQAITDMQLW